MKNKSSTEKTALILALVFFALFFYFFKTGNTKVSVCFLIAAFGGAVMIFASNKDAKKKD